MSGDKVTLTNQQDLELLLSLSFVKALTTVSVWLMMPSLPFTLRVINV